jgi:hypothetical protein
MCPSCLTNAAAIVATASSTGGILAVCLTKFTAFFKSNLLGPIRKTHIHQTSIHETKEK